jgi:hypothetical protein
LGEFFEHRVGPAEEDAVSGTAGGVSQGAGKKRFSNAYRA